MVIFITKDEKPRVFLMKDYTETYRSILKGLGINDYHIYWVEDSAFSLLKENRTAVIEIPTRA